MNGGVNQGLMSEACQRVPEFAFSDVGFRNMFLSSDNSASGRNMQKCGMKYGETEHKAVDKGQLAGNDDYYKWEKTME